MPKDWQRRTATRRSDLFVKPSAIDAITSTQKNMTCPRRSAFVGNFDQHGLWLCFIDFQSSSQVVNVSLAKKRWLLGWATHFYALMALLMSNLEHCILFIIQQWQFFKANWMQCRRVKDVADDNLFKSLLILGRGLAVAWDMKAILRTPGLCDSAAESWPPPSWPCLPPPRLYGWMGSQGMGRKSSLWPHLAIPQQLGAFSPTLQPFPTHACAAPHQTKVFKPTWARDAIHHICLPPKQGIFTHLNESSGGRFNISMETHFPSSQCRMPEVKRFDIKFSRTLQYRTDPHCFESIFHIP